MIGLLQRVSSARVEVDNKIIAHISTGLVVLVGVEKNDTEKHADKLLQRLLGYRVFADTEGKMNLGLAEISGDLLLIPQFTLPADTSSGMRPGFSHAAPPARGRVLFDYLVEQATRQYTQVYHGKFGADMQVTLTNNGPVTFWLQT